MATAMAIFHLAVICLALLPYNMIAEPAAAFHHRFLPLYASVLTMARDKLSVGTSRPASAHHRLHHAPVLPCPPRGHEVFAVDGENATAPPSPAHVHARAVTCSCSAIPSTEKALLHALPLLAIPFLPPPLAALVALSTLASPVGALYEDCDDLTPVTCAVYQYNGTVDRTRPVGGRRALCEHPLCHAGSQMRAHSLEFAQCQGRGDDPLHAYCVVRSLDQFGRVLHDYLPVANPDVVVASGGFVCYVELEHLGYREGYHIQCPVRVRQYVPILYCLEFPHEAIASAVWEHRRTTYRDTVGPQFATYNDGPQFDDAPGFHVEL